MSHTLDQNILNGIPSGIPAHLNGMESRSSHSSRDSSPSAGRMFAGVPGPGMRTLPSSQLPPSTTGGKMQQLAHSYAGMNIGNTATTPLSSPAPAQPTFGTSTPSAGTPVFNQSSVCSPITSAGFTHSATSHFSNVTLKAEVTSAPAPLIPPQHTQTREVPAQVAQVPVSQSQAPAAQIPSQRPPMQQQPPGRQQPPHMQTPQVPSNGPLRNGSHQHQQLPPQTSLPSGAQPTPLTRPPLQPSLSQPRLMAYNYPNMPVGTQASGPGVVQNQNTLNTAISQPTPPPPPPVAQMNGPATNGLQTLTPLTQPPAAQPQTMPPMPTSMHYQNAINARMSMPAPPMTSQQPPLTTSNYPQQYQQPSANSMPPMRQPPTGMLQQPPTGMQQPQQTTPNMYNQMQAGRPGIPASMPPKSNSLSGPEGYTNANISNKTGLHANRYPQQLPPQSQPQPQQPQMQQFNTNPIGGQTYNYQQQQHTQQPKFIPQQQPHAMQQIPLNSPQYQQQVQQTPQQIYGQPQHQQQQPQYQSTVQSGFNRLWGADNFDLLQTPAILPPTKVESPRISLGNPAMDEANCSPDIFRCTMTKIPESNSLLQKSRLPLGVLIHPFRDLNHLPVIQCNTIVRCRACRTYINPFVFFVDSKRWKCNLCYRVNELPEEFQYDPVTKTYGDPSRRPEVKSSTIEYIAPAEYMLRPPQPAIYLFLLDISRAAVESGYLHSLCSTLATEIANIPGDTRTHIGFIAYDSALHFFSLAEGLSQPHEMTVLDIDDIFLPCPDNLLVNLQDRMDLINDLLTQLPNRYNNSYDTGSALGAALQAAHKMMASTGGRITVFQSSLPSIGPGALLAREDPSNRASSDVLHLNPANDFYKRLALECSGQQIAVDLFILNSQYVDIATISGISRFSGGCMHHFPLFKASRELQNSAFQKSLKRYLTRKIGFEAVMRIRCTRGLTIHTFHGNFFVRSTDLLSLPNVNPDAGYGMQVAIEENLSDVQNICFQAALLYTSSKGERRIRVHTLCLPVVSTLSDVINSADQQCIVGLLAKMAVDRSMQASLADAREAFINVAIDILSSYKLSQNMSGSSTGLLVPRCLRLLPLYIAAMLKHPAFRSGISTRLDDRVKAMCDMKTRPLQYLIQCIYPDMYPVHNLHEQITVLNDEEEPVHMPPILQLSARSLDSNGAYLFDLCDHMVLVVCSAVSTTFLQQALGVADYNSITDSICELPVLDNEHNQRLHMFINYLNEEKPMCATLQIIRENSPLRGIFLERLVEDRVETALSYHEFLQHLKTQVK